MSRFVYAIATMDTKGVELIYVADCLRAAGMQVKVVDVGTGGLPTGKPDVTCDEVRGNASRASYESRAAAVTAIKRSRRGIISFISHFSGNLARQAIWLVGQTGSSGKLIHRNIQHSALRFLCFTVSCTPR